MFERLLSAILLAVLVWLLLAAQALHAEPERYWWAERLICIPDAEMPRHEACGLSRIGPWESEDQCRDHGPSAWRLESERLVKAGWGGLLMEREIACTYRGPQDTIS